MELYGDGENRISLIIDIKITDGKADTIYLALSNEIENCSRVESLSGFGSGGASVIIGHKKVASKLKRNYLQIISIHCHNYRLAFTIFPFFKESSCLMKNNYSIY